MNVAGPNAKRRRLRFSSLDEAIADAQSLLHSGYGRVGNWNLAQCCHHLSALMRYPIDSFPPFPMVMRIPIWILRHTVAPRVLKKILETEKWPEGKPTDRSSIPVDSGESDPHSVAGLVHAVHRLVGHTGELNPSPLLGLLDKPTLIRLHCIHAAHHLGLFIPSHETANREDPAVGPICDPERH